MRDSRRGGAHGGVGPRGCDHRLPRPTLRVADAHEASSPGYPLPGTLDEQIAQMQRVKSILFDADWMRTGGRTRRRPGRLADAADRARRGAGGRDLTDPGLFSLIEVLAPSLIDFAPPELAAEVVPRLLSGAEIWCQGFSEPATGSDLASLSCRAVPDGDAATASAWVINGQKVWTSLAQYADRCAVDAYRNSRVASPRDHRVLRRHGHSGDHRLSARDDQRRARVRGGVLRRRRRARRPDSR